MSAHALLKSLITLQAIIRYLAEICRVFPVGLNERGGSREVSSCAATLVRFWPIVAF